MYYYPIAAYSYSFAKRMVINHAFGTYRYSNFLGKETKSWA